MYFYYYSFVKPRTQFSKLLSIGFILFVLSMQLQAKNYYISSSGGNDNNTSIQAQNPATPWKSIAMVNLFFKNILPGDSIFLKRGDVFYGTLNVIASGSLNRPITIGAYGTGNKPVISGFKIISLWTQTSTAGIYQGTTSGISNNLNLVCINDQPQRIGRYPNATDSNGGYLNFEVGTNAYITDNQLPASPNWSGAELVIRKARHIIERWPITTQVGTTINYQADINKAYQLPSYVTSNNGYGYFIQKDIRCLDKFGEWFYDTKTGNFNMYFGAFNPSAYAIKVSTADALINISANNYITIIDLAFEGANVQSINIGSLNSSTSNVTINNCDFYNSGGTAVFATNSSRITIQNCNINNSYNNAIDVENEGGPSSFITIARNNIKNTGVEQGMGPVYGASCQGITTYASDAIIEKNTIDSAGYLGVAFYFNNAKVRNNYITNFAFVKDDGGGIYSWTGPIGSSAVYTGREVKDNILVNGIGAGFGTPNGLKTVYGIYMDDGVVGVDISGNSVTGCPEAGLYIHNTHELNITNNTVYNCGTNQMLYAHDNITPTDPIRNVVFKKNIMVAKTTDQLCFNFRTIKDDINLSGLTDSNFFARPINDDITISGTSPVIKTTYSLDRWKTNFSGKDVNSKKSPKIILPYVLNKLNTANLLTNSYFLTNITGISFWSQNNNQLASWDNTSKLTGTGSLKLTFPVSTPNTYTICTKSGLGAVSNVKNYIVRFSTLGTSVDGMLRVYLNNSSTNTKLVPLQLASYNTVRKDHEFLFAAPTSSATTSFVIEIQQNSGTTYVDNIEVFEADIKPVDINNEIRFEYNPSETSKTVVLDAKYLGVDSTTYDGTITLAPYSSKVLLKNGSVSPLIATATAPFINCFGGITTATVTASGGIVPYTGSGSFTASAGSGTIRISVASPVATNYTSLFSSIGTISNNKNYLLRFSTLGTISAGSLRASLRQTNSPFALLTPAQTKTFGTSRVDHEILFTSPTTESNGSLLIEILQSSGTTYIDNIAIFEANTAGVPISKNLYTNGNFDTSINGINTSSPTNNHIAALDLSSKITNTYYYPVTDAAGTIAISTLVTKQPNTALVANAIQGVNTNGATTVTVTASGGTAPYKGTGTFTSLQPGTYSYTVTDSLGCTAPVSITVVNRAPLSATATASAISCFGGNTIATIVASGGFAPYTGTGNFTINAGTGSLKISVPNPVTTNNTSIYASIGAVSSSKNYTLRFSTLGTTANGVLLVRLRQLNSPFNTLSAVITKSFGTSRIDHEFVLTPSSSDANAVFFIDISQTSGTTYIDNIAVFESTSAGVPVSDNLFAGGQFENGINNLTIWSPTNNHVAERDTSSKISNIYNYPVKDAGGSFVLAKVSVIQASSSPLTTTVTFVPITIAGGSTTVQVTATGGTAPYKGTGIFTNVKAGTYTYTVTDSLGCSDVKTVTTFTQPLTASASANAISCFGGTTTAVVSALGGTPPYTGTGNFTINAGVGSLKISVSNPVAGNTTTVYASMGAVSSSKNYVLRFSTTGSIANGVVGARLRQLNSPFNTLTPVISRSFGTSRVDHEFILTPSVSEANAVFLIVISQESGTTYIDNVAIFESTASGVPVSDNLIAGGQFENGISNIVAWSPTNNHLAEWDITSKISNVYDYLVKDASGLAIISHVATVASSALLTASSSAGIITVSGGTTTVVVSATGGTAPYTGTGTFTNVKGGVYTYTVTDALGCSVVTRLTINQPFGSSATAPAIKCFGESTIATVSALGGTLPHTGTGTYIINAGTGSLKLSVLNPVALNSTSAYAPIGAVNIGKNYLLRFSTFGTSINGSIKARLRMFNTPFNVLSSLGIKSFGLGREDHEFIFTASATEATACFLIDILQTSGTTYIDNIAFFEATASGVPVSDNLFAGGQFESGIGNVIIWSPTNNHLAEWDITSKITNTYNYPVKDAAGAFILNTVTTVQPLAPLVAIATAGSITSAGGTTTVTISATGGTPPYRGIGTLTGVQAGNYNFTVIDAAGCTSTASGVINVTSAARFSNANTLSGNNSGSNTLHSTTQPAAISSTLNADNKDLSIIVYPNPSENIFALKVVGAGKELVYISVTATDGRQLYSTKGNSNSIYSFGNNFKPGMYFVKVYQGTQVVIQKVVKGKF